MSRASNIPFAQALVEEARNATVALSGLPTRLTLARLVEEALQREFQRLRMRTLRARHSPNVMPNSSGDAHPIVTAVPWCAACLYALRTVRHIKLLDDERPGPCTVRWRVARGHPTSVR
jgi:hypothetical protein